MSDDPKNGVISISKIKKEIILTISKTNLFGLQKIKRTFCNDFLSETYKNPN